MCVALSDAFTRSVMKRHDLSMLLQRQLINKQQRMKSKASTGAYQECEDLDVCYNPGPAPFCLVAELGEVKRAVCLECFGIRNLKNWVQGPSGLGLFGAEGVQRRLLSVG